MGFGTYFALFFIFWWITLFLVLPLAGKSQVEEGDITLGTVKSAPAQPKLWRVVILNTMLAGAVFGVFFILVEVIGVTFEDVLALFPKF